MSSAPKYKIIDSFAISGRGLAVIIDETPDFGVGKPLSGRVIRPDNTEIAATAYRESLMRRNPEVIDRTAFLLMGLEKTQVPLGSHLQIDGYAP